MIAVVKDSKNLNRSLFSDRSIECASLARTLWIIFDRWASELDSCSPYSNSNSSTISNRTRITELDLSKIHRARWYCRARSSNSVTIGFFELGLRFLSSSSVCGLFFVELGLLSNSALLSSSVCNPAHAPHILYRTRFVIELGSSYSIQRRGVWCLVLEGGMGRARVAKSRTNEGILRMKFGKLSASKE